MTSNDPGTQNTYRAYLAYFLYTNDLANHDHRIAHQLLNNASAVQAQHGITDTQAMSIVDQAHTAAKAEAAAKAQQ